MRNTARLSESIQSARSRRFISGNPADKLSGGFFTETITGELLDRKVLRHPYFAFIYLLEGSGEFIDYEGRSHVFQPGCLAVRAPGKKYSVIKKGPGVWFEFAAAAPQSLYQALCAVKAIDEKTTFLSPGISAEIIAKAQSFIRSLDIFTSPSHTARACVSFLDLFTTIMEADRDGGRDISFKKMSEKARELLENSLSSKINMRQIAAKLGDGYESFRKKFTAEYGCGPKEYLVLRRLDKADNLLLHTAEPVKEIAFKLGYANPSDFVRQFRKHRGMSPLVFRKAQYD